MNKEWSELNKAMQRQISRQDTFETGIDTLFRLRHELMKQILDFKRTLGREDFSAIPFINADGYHSKTIAYSLYHVFRIEDITAHTLIMKDSQIFFAGGYREQMNSPIITTGNELVKQEIADFSAQLDIDGLYRYIADVDSSTEKLLRSLTFRDIKQRMTEQDKETLRSLGVVSEDENAVWLIDYWCGKNVEGLIKMPFSRHWIMHIEASLRILGKLKKSP